MTLLFDSHIPGKFPENIRICIVGYGNQGRAQALNLRDSGYDPRIALRADSVSRKKVSDDGLQCITLREICDYDFLCLLIPDEQIPTLFNKNIAPKLRVGQYILLAHSYALHFKKIAIPPGVHVLLLASSGPAFAMRRRYLSGDGIPAGYALVQGSESAKNLLLQYAKAIGCARAGIFETTVPEECETDLFAEQALLTGGIPQMMTMAFRVLVDAGYSPLSAWFCTFYEMQTMMELYQKMGFEALYSAISPTAKYGGLQSGAQLIDYKMQQKMKNLLQSIQSGEFAEKWEAESAAGMPKSRALLHEKVDELQESIFKLVQDAKNEM